MNSEKIKIWIEFLASFEALSQYLREETKENHDKPQSG
jgi:hypothetical protein